MPNHFANWLTDVCCTHIGLEDGAVDEHGHRRCVHPVSTQAALLFIKRLTSFDLRACRRLVSQRVWVSAVWNLVVDAGVNSRPVQGGPTYLHLNHKVGKHKAFAPGVDPWDL